MWEMPILKIVFEECVTEREEKKRNTRVVKTIEKSVSAEVCGIEEGKERPRAGLATGALSSERKK
jgi:hypothetical protein